MTADGHPGVRAAARATLLLSERMSSSRQHHCMTWRMVWRMDMKRCLREFD
jgi:hypothetical protein